MKLKHLIIALGILPIVVLLYIVAYFAAFAITVMTGGVDVLDAESAMVDQGIFNLLRYSLSLIVLGWFYYRGFYNYDKDLSESEIDNRKDSVRHSIKYLIKPVSIIALILAGFSIQLSTDSVLFILGTLFPTAFASYNNMMETFSGSTSILFIITTITIAPLVEEIAFRGLILRHLEFFFSEKAKSKKRTWITICFIQALLFGLYHMNLIQMTYAFIFGMLFGFLAIRFKSLVPSIILHMIVNGSFYLIPEGFLSNIPHSIIVGSISLIMLIAAIILLILRDASDKPSE